MTWTCRAGDWFAVLGEHTLVVLPPSEKARVAPVWSLVDDGAGFDETLDALISSGLRDLPGFVLVCREGDETRVVLRGEAHAHFETPDELVRVDGEAATTWVERTLHGVTRIRVQVAEETTADGGGAEELRVAAGLVRVASAAWGEAAEPAAPAPADPAPTEAIAIATDHDGLTRTGEQRPAPPAPGVPGQPPAPAVTRTVARLLLSTGERIDVDRVVLVGRAPEARGHADDVRLVPVRSPQQEISATHLEIRPGSGADHGSAVVTDLGSTNGTLLLQPGLPPEDLRAGVAVQLVPGAVVDLGDGLTIEVAHP